MNISHRNKSGGSAPLHVAVAVIRDSQGRILLARRPRHVHQGGLWEFPGGKIEPGEVVEQALARELIEELGIEPVSVSPLIRLHHQYTDKAVLLDVWQVDKFNGVAHGREGQPVEWVKAESLADYPLPEANQAILRAVRLPGLYLITPEPGDDHEGFLQELQRCLAAGVKLLQFRARSLNKKDFNTLAGQVIGLSGEYDASVMLNREIGLVPPLGAHGVHLTSEQLMTLRQRPLAEGYWVSASCHNRQELQLAQQLAVDFVVLAPVKKTNSHPEVVPLGWSGFHDLTENASVPVYALGGMSLADMQAARHHGSQGIALISGLWARPDEQALLLRAENI